MQKKIKNTGIQNVLSCSICEHVPLPEGPMRAISSPGRKYPLTFCKREICSFLSASFVTVYVMFLKLTSMPRLRKDGYCMRCLPLRDGLETSSTTGGGSMIWEMRLQTSMTEPICNTDVFNDEKHALLKEFFQ